MRLEGISAEIRPRNAWEAIDLGCVLTRRHYGAILQAWCATVLPLWLVILATLHDRLFWAMALIWWLKPVAERVPLFVLSRALFGDPLKWRELWREWPRMIGRRAVGTLFLRRLSPVRTLVAPVIELEGRQGEKLRGAGFRRRRNAITFGAGGAAFWMQVMVLLVLHSSWIGALLFAYAMVPDRYRPELMLLWDEFGQSGSPWTTGLTWAGVVLYLTSLTLVTPFFVGGGFGLYLNSRTRLDGWDVELAFRRMGNRLRNGTGAAAAVLAFAAMALALALSGSPARAQEAVRPAGAASTPDARQTIARVLQDPAFEIHKVKIYRLKDTDGEDTDLPRFHLPFLEGVGEVVTWCILVPLALFFLWLIGRSLVSGFGSRAGRAGSRRAPVKTVMGLNVEEEKLPPDLVSAARTLWNRGDWEDATRLLYRGAVSWLVHRGGVPIRESDTEVDCLRRVRAGLRSHAEYFGELTRVWILAAYGETRAGEEEMAGLFARWPFAAKAGTKGEAA